MAHFFKIVSVLRILEKNKTIQYLQRVVQLENIRKQIFQFFLLRIMVRKFLTFCQQIDKFQKNRISFFFLDSHRRQPLRPIRKVNRQNENHKEHSKEKFLKWICSHRMQCWMRITFVTPLLIVWTCVVIHGKEQRKERRRRKNLRSYWNLSCMLTLDVFQLYIVDSAFISLRWIFERWSIQNKISSW